ncbi:hypothetical protein FOZ60_009529 [Perkinsus olseni]|uniref:Uncharacterized protein n=1 Tax=Perkinsus olseni TaxID=32597 RepID=A0A7J6NH80_PEROL|nr:hypothetical protein FOZ60_009529 [Perkinsus olseni]
MAVGHVVDHVLPHYPCGRCAVLLKPFARDRAVCRSFLKVAKPTKHIRMRDTPEFTQTQDLSQAERWKLDGYLQFDEPDLGDTTPTLEGSATSSGESSGPSPEASGVVEMVAKDCAPVDQRVGCHVPVYQDTAIE